MKNFFFIYIDIDKIYHIQMVEGFTAKGKKKE